MENRLDTGLDVIKKDDRLHHFWYSAKQRKALDLPLLNYIDSDGRARLSRFPAHAHARIDGKLVEYTICRDADEPAEHGCKWDDMVYLGRGVIVERHGP